MRARVNYDVRKLEAQVVAFTASSLTGTLTFTHIGFLTTLIIDIPDFTGAITVAAVVADDDGNELYSVSELAKNTSYAIHLVNDYCPLYGEVTITLTLSNVAGGSGGNITVTPIVK